VYVDDMGMGPETVTANNECEAKMKLCQTVEKHDFRSSDVRAIEELKCTPILSAEE